MRSLIAGVFALLLFPVLSTAGSIHSSATFRTPGDWYGHLSFGLERVTSDAAIYFEEEDWVTRKLHAELELSGKLQGLTVERWPDGRYKRSYYNYGRTSVTVWASWLMPDGGMASGRLSAWLLKPLELEVTEGRFPEFTTIWNSYLIDRGYVDSALAEYLGVSRKIRGGVLHLDIDGITGDPTSEERIGRFYSSSLQINTVPEPGLAVLLAAGTLATAVRRRARRSSRSVRSDASESTK